MAKRTDSALKAVANLSYDELLTVLAKAAAVRRLADKATGGKISKAKLKHAPSAGLQIDWTAEKHTCPKCDHTGFVDPDFGVKVVRGVERRQSWCKTCRATTSYYDRPRKNLAR